jgi:two-component system, OmpR family, sensor histidine kinase ChvG
VIRWLRRAAGRLLRIRYRLLLVNLVVVVVPLGGIAFARMHERQLLAALEDDMVHQAQLLRAALVADPGPARLDGRGPMLAAAARDTRTRIRLLDAAGEVAADSHADGPPEGAEAPVPELLGGHGPYHAAEMPAPVDLPARAEVRAALAGRYGAATRLWREQQRVYLFVALPIVEDGRVVGVVYVTRSTQGVKRQLYRLRAWLVDVAALSVLSTAVLSLFLAATISRPLTRLTRLAEQVAAGARPPSPGRGRRDEIGQLARALDRMTVELDRRAHDMRDLAADLGHELRAPLTGIRGAAELLRDGAADDPVARARFLAIILDDAARLDRLITRLLELSRAESDDSEVDDVDLAELARTQAARHPDRVRVLAPAAAPVRGRRRGLEAAIDNLVANALHHADPDTAVTVVVEARRVSVHNHGAPLAPAIAVRVWDRFFTTRAETGGTGLGLAIVRSVIATHGGAVGVDSRAGAGTTFWFEL